MTKKHWVIITLLVIALGGAFSLKKNGIKLGLDLKGGSVLTYRIDTKGLSSGEANDRLSMSQFFWTPPTRWTA